MSLNIEDKGKAKVVKLEGKLDVNLSVSIESELDALIESGSINLILEISKVEYLSSSGIRVFINMMRKIKDKNGRLVLASVPDVIKKILKTVDLEDLFEVFDSVDDALATF
ncbi:STAS domain-containing protein [Brachyspira pilosicoli]|uniref:Anti-sigma factor antagonist n=5 Tax=Brachyspira pilosicoli TaxID=52584 RepID=D8IBX3_BRAP9|nr:STAS domain-containing protein [Brachyspira pilosicoli]ADK30646.1 anti sigma factor antagonist [Brachyspira pilosicoli 95/1000]AFR70071.1 anti sigma factor antagonist [Brachyspira pilosicoli B2904]AGA67527.1 anti sigma factor antagonist [Brachyspira pilosicoli P43/6/78]MBW5383306.1 anti-sigma factor antagonist [Brachyspira pilosicoli]MBW5391958.1 anti-sigma factor antagonist [Brachyspira pilosicoli]